MKQYNKRVHVSTKLTPIQASLKNNEGFADLTLFDKRKKLKQKCQVNDLVTTADIRKTFSKPDYTNYFSKLSKTTEVVNDNIPSYRIENLPERYNEGLLIKTELTLKEK